MAPWTWIKYYLCNFFTDYNVDNNKSSESLEKGSRKKPEEKNCNRKFKSESKSSNGGCNKGYSFQGGLSARVWGVGDAGLTAADECYNPGGLRASGRRQGGGPVPAWVERGLAHTGWLYSGLCRLDSGWDDNSHLILQKASNVTISR